MDLRLLADSKLPLLRSHEAVEVGEHLSRFLVSTKVTSADAFARPARVGGVRIGAFSLAFAEFGAPASIEAVGQGDYAVMLLCLHGSAQIEVDGRVIPVLANHGLLGLPCGLIRATFSGDCVRLVVRIESRLIERRSLFSTARFELSNPAIEPFLEQVHSVLSSRAMIAAIDNEPSVCRLTSARMCRATYGWRTSLGLPAPACERYRPVSSATVTSRPCSTCVTFGWTRHASACSPVVRCPRQRSTPASRIKAVSPTTIAAGSAIRRRQPAAAACSCSRPLQTARSRAISSCRVYVCARSWSRGFLRPRGDDGSPSLGYPPADSDTAQASGRRQWLPQGQWRTPRSPLHNRAGACRASPAARDPNPPQS